MKITQRIEDDATEVTQDSDPHSMSLSRGYPNASVFADGQDRGVHGWEVVP